MSPPSGRSVLMIAPTPFFADRGCHVRIYEEARLLRDLGYRIEICTYHNGRDIDDFPTHRILNVPWYRKLGPGPSWQKLYLDVLLFFRCISVVREMKPDIIHGHLHEGALIGSVLGRLFSIPCIADFQGSLTLELDDHGFGGRFRPLYRFLEWAEGCIDRMPDGIFASSAAMAEDATGRFGVDGDQVTVVPDAVGAHFFNGEGGLSREAAGIPADATVIVFMGVLTKHQGVDTLLDAAQIVLRDRPDAFFLVMGYPGEEALREDAARRGIGERVLFTGRVDYVGTGAYLALSDLAVSPKVSETEGNIKLFYYMAAGLGTIVFESGPNREILGDLGVYARDRSAEAFAEAILSTMKRPDELPELGAALRKRASEVCCWDNSRDRVARVYERLISASGSGAEGEGAGS
ncbi:MAG: glycosyltransferase family 4 protein [Gemmatimonadota bacterium]|nr:glycosyltransferase family 4 protein [Gemmatimonadota bacterium]